MMIKNKKEIANKERMGEGAEQPAEHWTEKLVQYWHGHGFDSLVGQGIFFPESTLSAEKK